jgi:hypothetical protein
VNKRLNRFVDDEGRIASEKRARKEPSELGSQIQNSSNEGEGKKVELEEGGKKRVVIKLITEER